MARFFLCDMRNGRITKELGDADISDAEAGNMARKYLTENELPPYEGKFVLAKEIFEDFSAVPMHDDQMLLGLICHSTFKA